MTSEMAQRFMDSLQKIEETGEVGPLVELFADDAELSRLGDDTVAEGRDGAKAFWQEYLSAFGEIHSNFTNVVEQDNMIVLEWNSKGTLSNGEPIDYPGVSILEVQDGKVQRFRTYYDSAAFVSADARV